jgi:hypothetical protein
MSDDQKIRRLRIYNYVMGLLHLLQGVVLILLTNSFELPINTTYLKFNPITQLLDSTTINLYNLKFGYWVAIFFFLSSLFHLIIATVYNKTYSENLKKGLNKARWSEYSLSASLMMVLIAMLGGIYDLSSLVMIFGLTAVMNLCGLIMEVSNEGKSKADWTSYWIGCFAGILPWVAVAIYFWGASTELENAVPAFVYWIFVTIALFFFSFAVNMYLQYKKMGPWKDYLFGEKVYIILSLVAKSALAWQIFAGTLRPN